MTVTASRPASRTGASPPRRCTGSGPPTARTSGTSASPATFGQDAKRLPDKDFDGEQSGHCEVIFLELANAHTAIVLPPQVHGCENSGPIEVSKNDLLPIPRSEWNDHDHYGM